MSDEQDMLVLVNFNSHEYPWFWPFSFPLLKLHYDIKLKIVNTPQGKKFTSQVGLHALCDLGCSVPLSASNISFCTQFLIRIAQALKLAEGVCILLMLQTFELQDDHLRISDSLLELPGVHLIVTGVYLREIWGWMVTQGVSICLNIACFIRQEKVPGKLQ